MARGNPHPTRSWKPGESGNPSGKPKGSVSIKAGVKRYLREHPDKFIEIVEEFVIDNKYRELMWKMLEGSPRQSTEVEHKIPKNLVDIFRDALQPDTSEGEEGEMEE